MKLLSLALISVVFVGSFALFVTPKIQNMVATYSPSDNIDKSLIPVLEKDKTFPILSGQGVIAIDLDSSVVLYEKDADLKLLPASTTKIATALVAMDYWQPDQVITIGKVSVDGQKMGLVEGEQMTVGDLLNGLLIYSANDAAEAFAIAYPEGKDAFITAMNAKAREIHLLNTHFMNPTGLDQDGHYSTARDMVRLAQVAMKNPLFASIVATKQKIVKSQDGKIVHYLTNINELLGKVDGVMGVKTGWTENARENLVTYIQRGNKRVIIALLGSQDRFGETKELIDWIYGNYVWQEPPLYKRALTKVFNPGTSQ